MPEPTTHKIEELKFKLKNDPKSRLFYPLAEELRKIGRFEDAEQYLRAGLAHHASYLSAWVSLGRILREIDKDQEAVEALKHALTVDPGNMVAAKLLAETYYDLGDKVEAIKKYKLVHALLPADDEISAKIEQLHRELNPPRIAVVEPPPSIVEQPKPAFRVLEPPPPAVEEMFSSDAIGEPPYQATEDETFAPEPPPVREDDRGRDAAPHEDLFDAASEAPPPPVSIEPTMVESGSLRSAADVDHRQAMSIFEFSPPAEKFSGDEDVISGTREDASGSSAFDWSSSQADRPADAQDFNEAPEYSRPDSPGLYNLSETAEPEESDSRAEAAGKDDEITATSTMADLYAQQGHQDAAREIYERLLEKDPGNAGLKQRLAEVSSSGGRSAEQNVSVERLQGWLRKIKGEAGRV